MFPQKAKVLLPPRPLAPSTGLPHEAGLREGAACRPGLRASCLVPRAPLGLQGFDRHSASAAETDRERKAREAELLKLQAFGRCHWSTSGQFKEPAPSRTAPDAFTRWPAALEAHPGSASLRAAVPPLEDGSGHLSACVWRLDPTAATRILRLARSCSEVASRVIASSSGLVVPHQCRAATASCQHVLRRGWTGQALPRS